MKRFPVSNIEINYDTIQELWCFYEWECLSKREIKHAVYNFLYGHLNRDYFEALAAENARIEVYWHAGWNEPIELTADNKKEMFVKLLKLYEKGLNSWIETFEKDSYKTKKERYRLNRYKRLLLELNKEVDLCYS